MIRSGSPGPAPTKKTVPRHLLPSLLKRETDVTRPAGVLDGRDFRGLDLAAAAPEDVRVENRKAGLFEMTVDGGFVLQHELFVGAVGDGHDVHVGEFRPTFPPVGVGEDMVAADLTTSFDLTTGGNPPVEECVVSRDALAGRGWFDVLQES